MRESERTNKRVFVEEEKKCFTNDMGKGRCLQRLLYNQCLMSGNSNNTIRAAIQKGRRDRQRWPYFLTCLHPCTLLQGSRALIIRRKVSKRLALAAVVGGDLGTQKDRRPHSLPVSLPHKEVQRADQGPLKPVVRFQTHCFRHFTSHRHGMGYPSKSHPRAAKLALA